MIHSPSTTPSRVNSSSALVGDCRENRVRHETGEVRPQLPLADGLVTPAVAHCLGLFQVL
jgi:hypothetical protein